MCMIKKRAKFVLSRIPYGNKEISARLRSAIYQTDVEFQRSCVQFLDRIKTDLLVQVLKELILLHSKSKNVMHSVCKKCSIPINRC